MRISWKFAFVAFLPFAHQILGEESNASYAIPIIDIEVLVNGSVKEKKESVVQEIGKACEEIGFFAITNHGVDTDLIDATWDMTRKFFDLPIEEKMAVPSKEPEYPYGYEQSERLVKGKSTDRSQTTSDLCKLDEGDEKSTCIDSDDNISPPDLKETFAIGPRDPEKSGMPGRRFPPKPEGMDKVYEDYFTSMEILTGRLLRSFALALDLKEDWFEDKMDRHMCALRALNYPDLEGVDPLPNQLRAGAHTDYGALTILKSGGPGLQVSKDGDIANWVDVPYIPNAFIINLGDLMQRWTNDKWVSTLHRVVIPPKDGQDNRRQSLAFFANINGDAEVVPIHTCVDEKHPSKYGKITAKEHLMSKHLASMGIEE
mmetsp:Transcript_16345/g.23848  ORF Transcript_16345/g.23848 Transcript_16345/m.23848 type:complete len:372 (-) Transcript_16345:817-1932(-)